MTCPDVLPIPEERFVTVDDRETLSLGDKTVESICNKRRGYR